MPEKLQELTAKERKFVIAYMGEAAGNASKAAELAGYAKTGALRVTASRLLRKAHIQAAIANTRSQITVATVADVAERREVLSSLLRSAEENGLVRINAANVLNKMDGLYVQKHDVRLSFSLEDLIAPAVREARP